MFETSLYILILPVSAKKYPAGLIEFSGPDYSRIDKFKSKWQKKKR